MGLPTASSLNTAINVSSLSAVSLSSSSLGVGNIDDYLIARRFTSGRVKELISALFDKDRVFFDQNIPERNRATFYGNCFQKVLVRNILVRMTSTMTSKTLSDHHNLAKKTDVFRKKHLRIDSSCISAAA